MPRGTTINNIEEFNRMPYKPIIDLYTDIENKPLKFDELRYLLLEKHELKRILQKSTKGKEIMNKNIKFRNNEMKLLKIRKLLIDEGIMLINTTGPSKEEPMNVNGLNSLLQTMKRFGIVEKVDKSYRITEYFRKALSREKQVERILSCPGNKITSFHGGSIMLYYFNDGENLRREFESEKANIDKQIKIILKEIMKIWAKQKIKSLIETLGSNKNIKNNGHFLGYCQEIVKWFIGSLDLNEDNFRDELQAIENIAYDIKTKEIMQAYVNRCIKGKKSIKNSYEINTSNNDEIDANSLTRNAIIQMIDRDELESEEGEWYLTNLEMMKLYRNLELHKLLSSESFNEEPVLIIDTRSIY